MLTSFALRDSRIFLQLLLGSVIIQESMRCSWLHNKVKIEEQQVAVPLWDKCLDGGAREPSLEYLDVLCVLCILYIHRKNNTKLSNHLL